MGLNAMLQQLAPPPDGNLEFRVRGLEERVKTLNRAVYGDPDNRVPALLDEVHSIRLSMAQQARYTAYWRFASILGYIILFGLLMGVLLR